MPTKASADSNEFFARTSLIPHRDPDGLDAGLGDEEDVLAGSRGGADDGVAVAAFEGVRAGDERAVRNGGGLAGDGQDHLAVPDWIETYVNGGVIGGHKGAGARAFEKMNFVGVAATGADVDAVDGGDDLITGDQRAVGQIHFELEGVGIGAGIVLDYESDLAGLDGNVGLQSDIYAGDVAV